jgi:hypothetical protein
MRRSSSKEPTLLVVHELSGGANRVSALSVIKGCHGRFYWSIFTDMHAAGSKYIIRITRISAYDHPIQAEPFLMQAVFRTFRFRHASFPPVVRNTIAIPLIWFVICASNNLSLTISIGAVKSKILSNEAIIQR